VFPLLPSPPPPRLFCGAERPVKLCDVSLDSETRDALKLMGASLLVGVLLCALFAFVGVALFFPHRSPPKEADVIRNFYTHRAAFELLRDMLIEDTKLVRLAGWGVQTTTSMATSERPTGDFPVDRYKQYLALLKESGGLGAHRDRDDPPADVCIWVYASGWAGDTRHLDVCWENQPPANQVASLDEFYRTPKPRKPVFRHVDSNWYLWADW
jgi:hypothetical protein